MNIDEIVEQLAFGKTTPNLPTCRGLYLSPDTIYLSELRMVKGKPSVDHLVRVPVPAGAAAKAAAGAGPSTSLNTNFLGERDKLTALIRQAMSQIRWNSDAVVVTISHHLGLLRYFTMPSVDRRFWASAIPLEAKKYIPIPFDALSYDYQIEPLPAAGPDQKARQGALVAVTPRKNLPNINSLVEDLGLKLAGLEVAPCSVLRLWNALEGGAGPDPYCQVHFDAGAVRVLICDRGLPVFFREVFLGAEATVNDSRKVDLGGCVSFAQKQLGVGSLKRLRVGGAAPDLPAWKESFSSELGLQAELHDTAALLGVKGGDWGGFASIGAAVRFLSPTRISLELGDLGKISDAERTAAKYLLAAAGAAALALCLAGFGHELLYRLRAVELKKYRGKPEVEAVFINKGPTDIENLIRDMQQQMELLPDPAELRKARTLPVLADVISSLPEKVWLARISLSNPLRASAVKPREIILSGYAMASSPSEERDKALSFKDRLGRSEIFGALFTDLQINVIHVAAGAESAMGGAGAEQIAFKRRLEQRTSFTITGKSKRGPGS